MSTLQLSSGTVSVPEDKSVTSGLVIHQAIPTQPANVPSVPKFHPKNAEFFNTAEIKDPEPIIETILYPGLGIFGAPNKFGKSYSVLLLACCVASGDPFLGFPIRRPGTVLYLDLEGNERRTKTRLERIGYPSMPEKLHIQYRMDVKRSDDGLLEQIKLWLSDFPDTSLILIDMWKNIAGAPRKNETEYDTVNRLLSPFQAFAIEKNFSIFLTLHTRKRNSKLIIDDPFEEITGSNAYFGNADCGWALLGKRSDKNKQLYILCRDNDEGQLEFEATFENYRYRIIGTREEVERDQERRNYEADPIVFTVRKMLETRDEWSATSTDITQMILLCTRQRLKTRFGTSIKPLIFPLLKYDHITVSLPSKNGGVNGRKYTFKKNKAEQMSIL